MTKNYIHKNNYIFLNIYRNSHRRCSVKKGVLTRFAKFREVCNFIKIETLLQVFSCEFCEMPKNTFFTEHVLTTGSASRD